MLLQVVIALVLVVVASGFAPAGTRAAISSPFTPSSNATLAPGVLHEHGSLIAHSRSMDVNVVTVDAARSGLNVRLSQAHGVATRTALVTEQAAAYGTDERHVVATLNGSTFFYLTAPDGTLVGGTGQGLNISDGELINAGAPVSGNGTLQAFGLDADDRAMIGTPSLSMELSVPGGSVAIDRLNQRRLENDLVLYTPRYDTRTWTDDLGDEYVIEGFDLPLRSTGTYSGTVAAVLDGSGDTPIGAGQVVLSAAAGFSGLASLAVGAEVSLEVRIDPAWQGIVNSVGGRNMLVVDGHDVTTNRNGYNPRAAVGIRADGRLLLLSTDDGDINGGGMTLPEMASLMLSLGAVDAVNLDGGNSTQMAVRSPGEADVTMANARLGAAEDFRPVVNALQVVSDSPPIENDVEPPNVDAPAIALAPVAKVSRQQATLDVTWSVTDDTSVAGVNLSWRVGSGQWRNLTMSSSPTGIARLLVPFGRRITVRARATDGHGNVSDWSPSRDVRVALVDDSSGAVTHGGGWRQRPESSAFEGAYRRSKSVDAWATLAHSGIQVGVIGQVGPRGGDALILVGEQVVATVSTDSSTIESRRLLYLTPAGSASEPPTANFRIRNKGTADQPFVDLDAFLVLEPAD